MMFITNSRGFISKKVYGGENKSFIVTEITVMMREEEDNISTDIISDHK